MCAVRRGDLDEVGVGSGRGSEGGSKWLGIMGGDGKYGRGKFERLNYNRKLGCGSHKNDKFKNYKQKGKIVLFHL